MASLHWNEDKEEILTAMWEERPFLYDHNMKGFNNRAKKDQAYREIAYAVGIPVGNVMKRMISLRTQYSRAKNRATRDEKPPSRKSRWLLDHLAFLAPFIETRNINNTTSFMKTEGFEEEEPVMESEMDFESVIPARVQFKKRDIAPLKRKMEMEEPEPEPEDFAEDLQSIYQDNSIKGMDRPADCVSPPLMKLQEVPVKKDQEQLFCDFLAGELREIRDPIARSKLVNKIQNDVFTFKMEELYKDSREGHSNLVDVGGHDPGMAPPRGSGQMNCGNNSILNTPTSTPHGSNLVNDNDSYKLSPTASHHAY